jgi:hypothetical protein
MIFRQFSFLSFWVICQKKGIKLSEYKTLQQLAVFWAPIAIEPAFTGL